MKYWKALMAAAMLLGLSSCGGGDDSDKNEPPPSASTPPGVTIEQPVYKADAAGTAEDPMMTVKFTANSQSGPVLGLKLGGTTLAQLMEEADRAAVPKGTLSVTATADAEAATAPVFTRWQSMFNKWRPNPNDVDPDSDDAEAKQASTNPKGNFEFKDNGDGSYSLKIFKIPATDTATGEEIINDPVSGNPLVFDESRTSRIGFQFTDAAGVAIKANPTYDWVPAGGTVHSRDMADTETNCYSCHDQNTLALHGGKRFEVKYCVTCHNPGTTGYGESYINKQVKTSFPLDMASMIHKIHRGKDLPSVNQGAAGGVDKAQFMIYGKDNKEHQYAYNVEAGNVTDDKAGHGVSYPQDTRNCSTCHSDSDPATPDAKNWYEKADARTCKSCHDMTEHKDTYTGASCTSCHGNPTYYVNTKSAHEGRVAALKAGAATLEIVVDHASYDGKQAKVDLRVLKDGEGIGFSDLESFLYTGNPAILINWNAGEGNGLAEANAIVHLDPVKTITYDPPCKEDNAGGFQCTLAIEGEVPADATLVVTNADWPLCVDRKTMDPGASGIPALKACSSISSLGDNPGDRFLMAANTVHAEFDLSGAPTSAEQFVDKTGADMASCKGCHKDQEFHKTASSFYHSVKEFVQCNSCHNATRAAYYAGMPGDLKYHVHSLHLFGAHRAGAAPDAEHGATFPASQNNCENCHTQEQYNLPNKVNARPSVITFNEDGEPTAPPLGTVKKYYSPTLVVCASCHIKDPLGKADLSGDDMAVDHMRDYGAIFGAANEEDAIGTEQCADCHAAGQEKGVDKVHNVYDFR